MGDVGNKEKWDKVYGIWSAVPIEKRKPIQEEYGRHYHNSLNAEDAMEMALISQGILPPKLLMDDGVQDYEDIMAGEEIWDQLQGSQRTA